MKQTCSSMNSNGEMTLESSKSTCVSAKSSEYWPSDNAQQPVKLRAGH